MRVQLMLLVLSSILFSAPTPAKVKPEACALITRSEIETMQGEPVVQMKSSRPAREGLFVSQCFYSLATPAKSVSLEVIRVDTDSPSSQDPRKEWNKFFHAEENDALAPDSPKSPKQGTEREGEKESAKPQRISGLADEAYWMESKGIGALYVLKGNNYLRISVGGPDENSVRLEKSKRLVRKALRRFSSGGAI